MDPNQFAPWAQQAAQTAGQQPGQLDPNMVNAVLQMTQQKGVRDKAGMQMKMADQMRQDAAGQLQGRQAGRTYIAPNIGNLASSVANSAAGAYMQGKGQGQLDDASAAEAKARKDWFDQWQKNRSAMSMGGTPASADMPMGSGY